MPKGRDTRNDGARIVDMNSWKARNHPATSAGGSGRKPPKKPKTTSGDPSRWDKSMGYFTDKFFPDAPKDPIEDRPDYKGNKGRISDMNPKNNPYFFKDED